MDNVITSEKQLNIDLFEVDMSSRGITDCQACDSVQSKLRLAIEKVTPLFKEIDCKIILNLHSVRSITEAKQLGVTGSPTIRVGDLDFYPEHLSETTEERLWHWDQKKYSDLNLNILIEIILKGYFERSQQDLNRDIQPYVLRYLSELGPATNECGCK